MGWGTPKRPKISNILSSPNPREGSDGDMQLRQTAVGAKLFGKLGGSWYSTPLSIKEGEFTLRTRNGSDSIKLDAATGLSIGNWKINKTSIYSGTEDHSTYTANAGDLTIYSDGSDASIHAREFYITTAGRFVSTNGTIGSGTVFADDIVTTASIANNAITDALLGFSAQSWTTDMEVRGTAYNAIIWDKGSDANPTLTFADGTTQVMTKNTSTGLADNTTFFVYVTENTDGAATVAVSSDYTDAVDQNKILLATVVVTTAAGGDAPSIFPIKTNALTISAASIAANSITATAIVAGTITATEIDTNSISADILDVGTVIVGEVGASKSNVQITGGAINLRTNTTNKVSLSTAGVLTMGDFEVASDGSMKISGKILTSAGTSNILIGTNQGDAGTYNIGLGSYALQDVEVGASSNIALGFYAGRNITTGDKNVCIGRSAGVSIQTGSLNTCIGYNTDLNATNAEGHILLGTATSPVRIVQEVDIRYADSADLSTIVQVPGVLIPAGSIIVSCSVIIETLSNLGTMKIAVFSRSTNGSSADTALTAASATYTELIGNVKDNIMTNVDLGTSEIDMSSGSGNLKKVWYTNDISSGNYTVDDGNDEYVYIVNKGTGNGTTNPSAGTIILSIEYIGLT
jgi:hypothetical protein